MSLFMKVLSDAYPRSLTVLTLLHMLTMQQPMAIYCMYGLIHLFIYELYFFKSVNTTVLGSFFFVCTILIYYIGKYIKWYFYFM